eukprot:347840_1
MSKRTESDNKNKKQIPSLPSSLSPHHHNYSRSRGSDVHNSYMSHRSHAIQSVPKLSTMSSSHSPPNHSTSRYGPSPKIRPRITMKSSYQSVFNAIEEKEIKKGHQRRERYIEERRRKFKVVRKFKDMLFSGNDVVLDDTKIKITNREKCILLTTQTKPDPSDPEGVVFCLEIY